MHKIAIFTFLLLTLNCEACKAPEKEQKNTEPIESQELKQEENTLLVGAEQIDKYIDLLKNKRVAMMVNQTSMCGDVHVVDTLLSLGVNLKKIFAPEHGFRGDHSAGAHVKTTTDAKTGLPIVSLYGKSRKPSQAMLADIDILIFDIQDVGVRFYTYISSMHYLMEGCAEAGKEFMVLDRPNPNGHYVDGPVLEPQFRSFIGMHEVPLVHGMTVGEFAKMINGEKWLKDGKTCPLTVIPCQWYTHSTKYKVPIRPSPNLPNMASIYLYPSLGLFEGTNVSVGRGTEMPFQLLGRPGLEEGSLSFTPKSIPGVADNPKYLGKECKGIGLKDFASTYVLTSQRIYLQWLFLFYESNNEEENGAFFKPFFNKLAGTTKLREQIESGMTVDEIYASWEEGLIKFKKMRKPYLLYPE